MQPGNIISSLTAFDSSVLYSLKIINIAKTGYVKNVNVERVLHSNDLSTSMEKVKSA